MSRILLPLRKGVTTVVPILAAAVLLSKFAEVYSWRLFSPEIASLVSINARYTYNLIGEICAFIASTSVGFLWQVREIVISQEHASLSEQFARLRNAIF